MRWTIIFTTVELILCFSILDILNTNMDEQFLIQNLDSGEVVQAQGKCKLEPSDLDRSSFYSISYFESSV